MPDKTRPSAGDYDFPYEDFRRGQKELAEAVENSVRRGEILVVRAPTGYGKTAAVIYGLLRSGADKVLYVVRTINELDPVVRELKRFSARFTFLFSARKMCPLMSMEGSQPPPADDFWAACRIARARGLCSYYDNYRMRDAEVYRSHVENAPAISAYRIAWDIARHMDSCPFFALKSLIDDSLFIVATYPYLFKRDIFETFLEPYGYEDFVVVVDEAHSLINAHTMLESRISENDVRGAIREVERFAREASLAVRGLKALAEFMGRLSAEIRGPGKLRLLDKVRVLELIGDYEIVIDVADEVRTRIIEEAMASMGYPGLARTRTSISKIAEWLKTLALEETSLFAEFEEGPGDSRAWLMATPLDPAVVVKEPLEKARAAILMSGTIPPGDFVGEGLGVARTRTLVDVQLAYGIGPLGSYYTVVVADVTTAYRRRSSLMYRLIAERVSAIASRMPGAKLAVYPSYEVLNSVVGSLNYTSDVVVESRDTTLEEVEKRLLESGEELLINAVAGGKLVEGVEFLDYEGRNMLTTVIVVGVPFPQPDDYTRRHLEVLSKRLGAAKARRLVYLIQPAVKVRQALGRAIRGPEDRAAYFLLDYRYLRSDVRSAMGIQYNRVVRSFEELEEVLERLAKFMGGKA